MCLAVRAPEAPRSPMYRSQMEGTPVEGEHDDSQLAQQIVGHLSRRQSQD
jgi:hypothetical protein